MQKTLSLAIGISLLFTLSACQPKPEAPKVEAKDSSAQSRQPSIIEKSPKPVVSDDSAIDAKTCLALNKSMQKINNTSKIEDIYAIQILLKTCLPTANNAEVLKLLKNYQAMYQRFLEDNAAVNEVDFDEDYYEVMYALEWDKKVPVKSLEKLSARTRYLVNLIGSGADVSVRNLGEGFYTFAHNLQAMAEIFTPYLRPDQKAFIGRMAKDNQEIFWSDAAITTTFSELTERAIFWEDYIRRFPNGYAAKDAKTLLNLYRYSLFFGSDNTGWTDDAIREFIEPEYERLMMALAKRPSGILAKDAQQYLYFMSLSDSERQAHYPAPRTTEEGYEMDRFATVSYQLNEAMKIPSIWRINSDNRNCLDGVFCHNESTE